MPSLFTDTDKCVLYNLNIGTDTDTHTDNVGLTSCKT